MRSLIEQIEFKAQSMPKKVMLIDEVMTNGITCEEIDSVSGRVYAYLKNHGIGREDFVLINLARGILPVVAMVGVLKAGAAFTIVEEGYPAERVEYIRKDCGCKAEINREVWEEILKCEPLSGHEQTDDHDAAYAVYTSGTTGNPKGVLHEYGNIEQGIIGSFWDGKPICGENCISVLLTPMNFVASIMLMFDLLYASNRKYYIASYSTIKNPVLLTKMLIEKRVNGLFLTPSYARMIGNKLSPFVKTIVVGSEPANNLYIDNVDIYNIYSMSESGFAAAVFKIDKSYDVCPIGKPQLELKCMLLDEDGNDVSDGEIGEFCFENKYVRGYINLPEENKKAFVNGIYHTGDLAKKLPDGNFALIGRSSDMIKINGNRIEPAEIETAVKSALGIDWAAAKSFESDKQSYICVYYIADVEIDTKKLRAELLKKLPYYMIPSYYMHIDNVPLRPNGKLDRQALPQPERSDVSTNYAEPTNDTEKALCDAFAKVLELEKVGIYDDFYELGGDSLSSIETIMECGLPGLEASMIFRGRTAASIARLYLEEYGNGESDDEMNAKSMKQSHRLTTEQLHMIDYQLYTPMSTMYNLFAMLKYKKDTVDPSKLMNAVESAIRNHPALLTKFSFNEDGEIVQSYDESLMPELRIEKISEFDFEILKDTLVQPFKIINSRLFRNRIFETEKAVYVFFDLHHTIFDGTSFKVLMNDIIQAYAGTALLTDYYYLTLKKREDAVLTPFYEESRKYFEDRYDGDDWVSFPPVDHVTRDNEFGHLQCEQKIDAAALGALEKKYKISRNEFFIAVSSLAVSMYADKPNVKLSWIYNGRDSAYMMNTIGLLFRDLPVAFRFDKNQKISDIFADTHSQVKKAIEHSCYPYVENNIQIAESDVTSVLYQRDIRETKKADDGMTETVNIKQNRAASQNILDIEILDDSDGLRILLEYSSSRYDRSSMEKFGGLLIQIASVLINSSNDITIEEMKSAVKALAANGIVGGKPNDEENALSMKQPHRLTTEQMYMFDYQLYTPMSTMYNLFKMLKCDKQLFEPAKLIKAVEAAIRCHPSMLTEFYFDDDGMVVQRYNPSLMPEIRVEKISEFDLKLLKDTLVQPFKIINSRLFRCRIFETEKSIYLFLDIHHTVFDGASFKAFMHSVTRAYKGISLATDHYYLALKKREDAVHTPFYEESRRYFEERYDGDDWVTFPPIDHATRENTFGQLVCETMIDSDKLRTIEKKYKISRNDFFIVVSSLAVSICADKPNVKLSWIHHGRDSFEMMNAAGLLYRDLPVAFRFNRNLKISDVFTDAHNQVQKAVEHSCYPYVEKSSRAVEDDIACVLYQHDIRSGIKIGKTAVEDVEIKQNRAAAQNILDIEILDDADGFQLQLDYSSSRYDQSSIERFGNLFVRIAASLIHSACENNITIGELYDEVKNA